MSKQLRWVRPRVWLCYLPGRESGERGLLSAMRMRLVGRLASAVGSITTGLSRGGRNIGHLSAALGKVAGEHDSLLKHLGRYRGTCASFAWLRPTRKVHRIVLCMSVLCEVTASHDLIP